MNQNSISYNEFPINNPSIKTADNIRNIKVRF